MPKWQPLNSGTAATRKYRKGGYYGLSLKTLRSAAWESAPNLWDLRQIHDDMALG